MKNKATKKQRPLFLGIVFGLFILVAILPVVYLYGVSFFPEGAFSFSAYQGLLDSRQLTLLGRSLALAASTAVLAGLLGAPLALLLARTDLNFRKAYSWLYLVPLLIPPPIQAVAWIRLLGPKGVFSSTANTIFPGFPGFPSIHGFWGCVFVLALSYYPFITLLTLSGLNSIDRKLEESGMFSRGGLGVVSRITLPLALPHMLSGMAFVFIFSLINYGVPSLLRVNTYPVEVFIQFSAFYQEAAAVATSLPLILISTVLVLVIAAWMRGRPYVSMKTGGQGIQFSLGRLRIPAGVYPAGMVMLSVVLPILGLAYMAGGAGSFTVAIQRFYRPLLISLLVSAGVATVLIFLAAPIAYVIERGTSRARGWMDVLSVIPFAVPGTVLGIGLIRLWNRPETAFLYGTLGMVMIAGVARFIPFSIRALVAGIGQIDRKLEEAAEIAEPRSRVRTVKILVPLLKPALAAGWAVVFVLSLGELGASLLVLPAGLETLPVAVYNLMHYGANQIVGALSLILVGCSLAALIPVIFIVSPRKR